MVQSKSFPGSNCKLIFLKSVLKQIMNDMFGPKIRPVLDSMLLNVRCRSADRAYSSQAFSNKMASLNTEHNPRNMLYQLYSRYLASKISPKEPSLLEKQQIPGFLIDASRFKTCSPSPSIQSPSLSYSRALRESIPDGSPSKKVK